MLLRRSLPMYYIPQPIPPRQIAKLCHPHLLIAPIEGPRHAPKAITCKWKRDEALANKRCDSQTRILEFSSILLHRGSAKHEAMHDQSSRRDRCCNKSTSQKTRSACKDFRTLAAIVEYRALFVDLPDQAWTSLQTTSAARCTANVCMHRVAGLGIIVLNEVGLVDPVHQQTVLYIQISRTRYECSL
jgi:hypothetical protein